VDDLPRQKRFELGAAYPNPFNPSTTIPYQLSSESGTADVLLQVLDIRGRLVRTLVSARQENGPLFEAVWNGRNQFGAAMPSGVYIVNLSVDGEKQGRLINLVE